MRSPTSFTHRLWQVPTSRNRSTLSKPADFQRVMRVRVQLFAVARELQGADQVELELPEGGTVADLREAIRTQAPKLAGLLAQLKFAVDEEYASDQTPIAPGAAVACIPPVSGG